VSWKNFVTYAGVLREVAAELKTIPLKVPFAEAPRILISGEIYIRLTRLATQPLKDRLWRDGFVTMHTTPTEVVRFEDMIRWRNLNADYQPLSNMQRVRHRVQMFAEDLYESWITKALSRSGLIDDHVDDVHEILRAAEPYISPRLAGEAILTVGGALEAAKQGCCGVVVIAPFGCMPARIASGILSCASRCPMFFYEADGGPLPPILESQLEVFSLVARKAHAGVRAGG
jgi:predicted nucleotide-binding protein (sugar kinase/HSP70/actin superfamily)